MEYKIVISGNFIIKYGVWLIKAKLHRLLYAYVGNGGPCLQTADAHTQQAYPVLHGDALQAQSGSAMYGRRVGRGIGQRQVARNRAEILETQLDTYGTPNVTLARQIALQLLA